MSRTKTGGWNWTAFFLGPFWYIVKGIVKKGVWLLVLCTVTIGLAVPFVWIYCAARANGDWYDFRLKRKSQIDLDEL